MVNKFPDMKNKKILIYGTGKVAEHLLMETFSDAQIVGVIDKVKFCGEKCGFPILTWDDLQSGDADVIVIAAPQKYYREIYLRIVEKCVAFGMQIYGANGENLIQYFGLGINLYQDFRYYEKNAEELGRILKRYDVISFDVFDTLIMRKTLEPTDIFDIVETRLEAAGMILKGFKAIRRQAELLSKGQNIYVIYDILQQMTGISDVWKARIIEEELQCEKDFIIGRKAVIEIYRELVNAGKKVYLVSDMYLPADRMAEILNDVGIGGYEKIYVSCEYGVGKGNGLFEKLCEEIGNSSCIHIGDNRESDVRAAIRYGLDAYELKSAYAMLHDSNLHYVLGFTTHINDKNLAGLVISNLFNDPFALYHTSGRVGVSALGQAGVLLLGPLAIVYMSLLLEKIEREKYDGILFVARDESFFYKLYRRLMESIPDSIPAYYVYSSRKLSIRSGMDTLEDMKQALSNVYNTAEKDVLYELFGVDCSQQGIHSKKGNCGDIYYFQKEIMEHSQATRRNYAEYLKSLGLDFKKKYLLCELDGKGTSHYYLNRFFEQELDSLYMARQHYMDDFYQMKSEAVYDCWRGDCEYHSVNVNTAFIESIFSAPHPSVEDMEEGGIPVFAEEVRSEEQIKIMLKMQDAMEAFCEEYFRTMYISDKPMNRELPLHFLELFPYINYEGECKALYRGKLYDEMSQVYLDMMTGERIQQ